MFVLYQIKHLGLIESESETIDAKFIFYTLYRSVQLMDDETGVLVDMFLMR